MIPQPLIGVSDVEASSSSNQRLLGCQSDHGGPSHWEIWRRDSDSYTVVPASPDGTAKKSLIHGTGTTSL